MFAVDATLVSDVSSARLAAVIIVIVELVVTVTTGAPFGMDELLVSTMMRFDGKSEVD